MKIDIKSLTGEINLGQAHSIILNSKPQLVKTGKLKKLIKNESHAETSSFGLFETASPNYTTYYPDVTAEDLKPKDEEFIEPVFRMLSETIVSKYRPIDFSKPGVLKASMNMLLGQTINIDHEIAVGNAIGSVSSVYWQNSYKTKDGVTVPAGINGVFKIDGKSNPRIARGIMMNPPSIHSNSVTVKFQWEPSHSFEDIYDFYNKLGTYDSDGNMYRLIVTQILNYSETSLVSHGADTWAQIVDSNGEINNPQYAERNSLSFSPTGDECFITNKESGLFKSYASFNYKTDLITDSDNSNRTIPKNINNNNQEENLKNNNNVTVMKELIKSLMGPLSFNEGELTEDNISAKLIEKFNDLNGKVTENENLTQQVQNLTNEKSELENKLADLKESKPMLDQMLSDTRAEAIRLYKLTKGDDADETILKIMGEADLKTAKAFQNQYQKEVDEKFQLTCQDCNSKNVSRASAKSDDGGEGQGKKSEDKKRLTADDFKKKKKSIISSQNSKND